MTEEQKRQLEQQLWNIANALRGRMNPDEFRDYILGFIFFKYLSEKLAAYANEILAQDQIDYLDVSEETENGKEILEAVKEEAVAELGYFLKPSELFSKIAERGAAKGKEGESTFILDDLTRILSNIEKSTMGTASEDDFDKLFEDLDLTSTKLGRTEKAKNEVIVKVLSHLNEIDFELYKSDSDVLGDAYEYLIGKFAAGAGKKAGEFYTPREVSTILARIVTTGKERLKSVYDPTCGSGSLLLRVAREAKNADAVQFYGQERNRTTYNLARMNMLLHGVHYTRFNIQQEDTLEHPQHPLDMRFEAVVANPPFSAKWSANVTFETDDRFAQYGRLAPASKADFAFVQHMLHYLDDNGTMAVILPHGVLFRGGSEAHIRKYLIKDKNWLDAVIGLPPNIFYGTSIATCLLIFKKCRESADHVLFIDGSAFFDRQKNQNALRNGDIDRIVNCYRNRAEIDKFSRPVKMDEIEANDFNLNIPRYIDIFEKSDILSIDAIAAALKSSQLRLEKADQSISRFTQELQIPAPVGVNADLLRRYKQGVMQKLFTQSLRFKRDDGSDYPDWKDQLLGADFIEHRERVPAPTTLPIYSSSREGLKEQREYFADREVANEGEYGVVPDGFITYRHMSDDLTFRFNLNNTGSRIAVSKEYPVFACKSGSAKFMIEWLNGSEDFAKFAITQKTGGTRTRLYYNKLADWAVQLPSSDEQFKIAEFLTAIDEKITTIEDKSTKVAEFLDAPALHEH